MRGAAFENTTSQHILISKFVPDTHDICSPTPPPPSHVYSPNTVQQWHGLQKRTACGNSGAFRRNLPHVIPRGHLPAVQQRRWPQDNRYEHSSIIDLSVSLENNRNWERKREQITDQWAEVVSYTKSVMVEQLVELNGAYEPYLIAHLHLIIYLRTFLWCVFNSDVQKKISN